MSIVWEISGFMANHSASVHSSATVSTAMFPYIRDTHSMLLPDLPRASFFSYPLIFIPYFQNLDPLLLVPYFLKKKKKKRLKIARTINSAKNSARYFWAKKKSARYF